MGSFTMTNRTFTHNLPPNFVIDPFFRIWFINRYNTYNRIETYLDVQRSFFISVAIYKTTGAVFIRGIVLNDFACKNNLLYLFRTDTPIDSLFSAVFSITEFSLYKCITNLFNVHGNNISQEKLYVNNRQAGLPIGPAIYLSGEKPLIFIADGGHPFMLIKSGILKAG